MWFYPIGILILMMPLVVLVLALASRHGYREHERLGEELDPDDILARLMVACSTSSNAAK